MKIILSRKGFDSESDGYEVVMKKKWISPLFILLSTLAFVFIISIFITEQPNSQSVKASNGAIFISKEQISKYKVINLDGEWKYCEGIDSKDSLMTVKVPDEWARYHSSRQSNSSYGTGTFYLRVFLPDASTESWALYIPDIRTARLVFIDGVEVEKQGKISENYKKTIPYDLPSVVFFHTDNKYIDLKIVVSNNVYALEGGIHKSIALGTAKEITEYRTLRVLTVAGISCAYAVFGFVFLVMFLYRRKDYLLIVFSMYCFSNAMLYLTNNELLFLAYFHNMNYETFRFIQYVTAATNVVLLLLYTRMAIPRQTKSVFYKSLIIGSIMVVFVPILFPIDIWTRISYWHPFVFLAIVVAVVVYSLKAVIEKEEFSNYFFISALSLLTVFTMFLMGMYGEFDVVVSPLYAAVPFAMANAAFLAARHSKAHERAEKLAIDLQKQDKIKNEFLAKTSHEFRTPLHGIMNIIGLYIEKEKQFMNQDDLQNMNLAIDISKRLSRLVNDILDLDLMQEGKLRLEKSIFSIDKCLKDVVTVCRYVYSGRENQIELLVEQDMPMIQMDIDRFKQIVYNIVDNSMNHSHLGIIKIEVSHEANDLLISISDNGLGIKQENLNKIFDPYSHFGDTKSFGAGIGLSIVKQLVLYMDGSIYVESEYEKGTVFRLVFNSVIETTRTDWNDEYTGENLVIEQANLFKQEGQLINSEIKTPYIVNQNSENTILVVDDNFSNLKIIIDALRTDSHNIIAVKSGTEMLEIIKSYKDIDLIILDLLLPDYSGYDLCKKLREQSTMVELPILILTAAINPEDLQYALSIGANDFIHKPYSLSELKARVNSLLHMKSEAKKSATYEIAFLHAQIKPHFLYNALNTIAEFCVKDPFEASDLIISLSKYLRGTLDFSNLGNLVSIEKEIALVKAYLSIEQARYPELRAEFNLAEEMDFQLPPMTLQVLVENAVKHGIVGNEDGGLVKIQIKRVDEGIELAVHDDGAGMTIIQLEEILKIPKNESGIGLYNVNKRLIKTFGNGLSFKQEDERGFTVSFIVPDEKRVL